MRDAEQAVVQLEQGAALTNVIDTADAAAWTALDKAVRSTPWYALHGALPTLAEVEGRPEKRLLRRAGPREPLGRSRLALALCHPNGRVRAAALEQAAGDGALLPLLVVRSADWAEPVRKRARELLREAMPRLGTPELAALAPLLLRVGRRRRGDFGEALLTRRMHELPEDDIRQLLDTQDRAVRRSVSHFALERGMLSAAELAGTAARDRDTVVRRLCAAAVIGQISPQTADAVLGRLLTARSADTRSAGVTALRRAGRPAEAEPFLTDRSAVVRACARYVVRQGGVDPLPRYRAWCAAPQDLTLPAGAPVGLAECGTREDAGLLWPLLGHPAAGVRAQAVAGLRLLDVVDAERLRPLLTDDAPAVARETARALVPYACRLPEAWLSDLLAADHPAHTRHAAFRLLDARGGVDQLRAAAGLLDDADARLRFRAEQSVRRWQRPAATSGVEAAVLQPLLSQCAHLLGRRR